MPGGPVLMAARWVVGHEDGRHVVYEDGEVVFEGDRIVFVGHGYPGEVARRVDCGNALIGPGFIDLDALSDLDTTVLAFDNQPAWKKSRVWPESYMRGGPYEMYTPEELAWQKRYAFARLIRNGITTALPIASLFYREWGETWDEFAAAADAAEELGLRVYLGPAYRTGNSVVRDDGTIRLHFDEERGLAGLAEAERFCRDFEGRAGRLVRTMLAPDRIETCTPELLRRSAAAARDLDVPVRLHCCQSLYEYEMVLRLHGMSPPEWLARLGFLSERVILPHLTVVSGENGVTRDTPDLRIIADSGPSLAHCPLVMARHGTALRSFRRCRELGINIGMGTDTHPPDMILNMQLGLMLARVADGDAQAVRAENLYDAATLGGARALGRDDLGRLAPGAQADLVVLRDPSWMPPGKVLEMATVDAARALGLADELGSLERGKRADIVLLEMRKPHLWPPQMPVTRIAHFANAADVDTVIVEGEVLMRGRRPLRVDETAILEEAAAELRRALDRTGLGHLAAEPPDYWRTARRDASSYPVAR